MPAIDHLKKALALTLGQITAVAQAAAQDIAALRSGKQDKLTGAAGQVVGFDAAGKAAAVQGWSNPNLVPNWYFPDPVNTNGKTVYTGGSGELETIDTWTLNDPAASVSLSEAGITIKGAGVIVWAVFDRLNFCESIAGKVFTMTALTTSNEMATVTAAMVGSGDVSHHAQIADTDWFVDIWEYSGKIYPRIYKVASGTSSVSVAAVKLERSDHQTLARKDAGGKWVLNDLPPDKNLEKVRCRGAISVLKGSFTIPASGWSTDSTTGYTRYYDVAVSGVTANDRADIIIAPGSVNAAAACGFCPVSETLAGKIRIRATKVPSAAIAAEYWIEKE